MVVFSVISVLFVVAGAVYSAFSAKTPTRFAMWLTAYLVLIAGVMQAGLLYGWSLLDLEFGAIVYLAFILYNVGNIFVMIGRAFKGAKSWARSSIYLGGAVLMVSTIMLLVQSVAIDFSTSHLVLLLAILTILVSMPIGLVLARKSYYKVKKSKD